MSRMFELLAQAAACREQARRARRLADALSRDDREQLRAHAGELEIQAIELERQAGKAADDTPPAPVANAAPRQVQQQQQQQQQQDAAPKPAGPTDPKRSP